MITKKMATEFANPTLSCLALISLCALFTHHSPIASAQSGSLEKVTAGTPVRKSMTLYTTQPGTVRAYEEAPLHSRITGYVKKVNVDIGDRVEAGQPLIEIDAPELGNEVTRHQALVAQAVAEFSQAEAAISAAAASVRSAEARVSGVEAGVLRTDAEIEHRKAEYDRIKELAGRGTVNVKLVDESMNQLRAAEAAREEARAAIESATAMVEEARAFQQKSEADSVAARSRIDVAKANLARAETMLQFTLIKAPFNGTITQRQVDTGYSVVPAGGAMSAPLLVIARHDIARVFTDVPETEAALVTAGGEEADPATVTIQALGNRSFESTITRTSWSLDPSNRSLRTEIDLPNEDASIRPGMYAMVQIRLAERQNALTLPLGAIIREATGARCCVVVNSKIEYRPIVLGLRSGDDFEIVSGISDSDNVVLARAGGLQNGQVVEVLPTSK